MAQKSSLVWRGGMAGAMQGAWSLRRGQPWPEAEPWLGLDWGWKYAYGSRLTWNQAFTPYVHLLLLMCTFTSYVYLTTVLGALCPLLKSFVFV